MFKSIVRSVALALSVFAFADVSAIGLEECCKMARDNYPEIRRLKLIEATRDLTMENIMTRWLPQVTVSGQGSWQNSAGDLLEIFTSEGLAMIDNGLRDIKPIKQWQYQAGVDVAQTVWDGGAIALQRQITAADADIQQKNIDILLYALHGRVEEVFFSTLLMESHLEQTETKLTMLQVNRERIETLCQNGTVADNEADILEVEEVVSQQLVKALKSKINMHRQVLTLLTGEDMMKVTLDRPPLPSTYAQASDIRPEYALLDAQAKRQMLELKRLDVNLMPKVSLFGQGYYGYPDMNVFRSMTDESMSFNFKFGLRVTWSPSEFYTRRRSGRIIAHRLDEINVKRDMLDYDCRMSAVMLTPEVKRLESTLDDDRRIIDLRRKIRQAEESKLNNGIVDATELRQKIIDETNALQDFELHSLELLKTVYQLNHNGIPSSTK